MLSRKQANALLPQIATSAKIDPLILVWLLIAVPKWGKTTFFMKFPDSVLLAFEQGHMFHSGRKIIIDCWDYPRGNLIKPFKDKDGNVHMSMAQAVDVLTAGDLFRFVIFDTVDMAVKMCVDYHCAKMGLGHPSELEWGRGYDQTQNNPFRHAVLRILKSGRGIGFTTHSKTEITRFTTGEKARKETTLPAGIARFVTSQADIIGHGEFGKRREGIRYRDRILALEGDADTLAGNRSGAILPARYVVDPQHTWKQLSRFFRDPSAADKAESDLARSLRRGKG